jgi:ribosome recycling factor
MARRDANEVFKNALKDKVISEDENKSGSDVIQKLTDEYIKKVDGVGDEKEKELMSF